MQNTERSVSGCNKGATEIIPSEIQTEKGWGKMSRLMTVEEEKNVVKKKYLKNG